MRHRYPNPIKRAIDRKVAIPVYWIAWRTPMPERLFDRLLAWCYRHAGGGAAPTKRDWARAREAARALPLTPRARFERPTPDEMRIVDSLPYSPQRRVVAAIEAASQRLRDGTDGSLEIDDADMPEYGGGAPELADDIAQAVLGRLPDAEA